MYTQDELESAIKLAYCLGVHNGREETVAGLKLGIDLRDINQIDLDAYILTKKIVNSTVADKKQN